LSKFLVMSLVVEKVSWPVLFLGRLPQGIVCGFCWCKTLHKRFDGIIFAAIEELFEFLCCCDK
jgi:hypothetical protein